MTVQDIESPDELVPEYTAVPDRFAVTDEGSANWVCRRIIEARLYADRVKQWAERELRRAAHEEDWFTRRFAGELEQWTRGELVARGGKARSVRLPAAQVGFRRTPATFRMADTAILVPWCQQHLPEALRLKVDAKGQAAQSLANLLHAAKLEVVVENGVTAAEVQKYVTTSGEVPPGVEAVDGRDLFFVR